MTEFVIVRHGESTGNQNNEFHGQTNSDITEKGVLQARETGEFLKDVHFDAVYSSDIRRAMSTARNVLGDRKLEIVPCKELREIYAGKWELMKFTDIAEEYPEEYKLWKEDIANCRCPGGESVRELRDRIKAAFDGIAKENNGKRILVTTHATPIRVMYSIWKGLPLEVVSSVKWVSNASVTVVRYDNLGGYELLSYGESEHLEKAGLVTKLSKKI